jgi:hypothetical protein
MTKEARMTKKKTLDFTPAGGDSRLDIRTSAFFRHSTFGIRHSAFTANVAKSH